MPLRHWLRCATPRTSLVCLQPTAHTTPRRTPYITRNVSSTPPAAGAMSLPMPLAAFPALRKSWSWLFPELTSSCGCSNHGASKETKQGKTYALHREQLHQALVDHFHEIEQLYRGNVEYVRKMGETNPGLLEDLAFEGQRPPFMLIDCSDSRVSEQSIFNAQPGTMFTAGNIANMFDESDTNSNAVLSYAVETLGVKHVVVLGHYGCGGVAASMSPPPSSVKQRSLSAEGEIPKGLDLTCPAPTASELAVQRWIAPIRHVYETSDRWEIRAHREKTARQKKNGIPQSSKPIHLHDPSFRALVEENVKANAKRVAASQIVKDHYAALSKVNPSPPPPASLAGAGVAASPINPVYIHGWVYDLETGVVSDLGVSVGPPGWSTPRTYSDGFPYTR